MSLKKLKNKKIYFVISFLSILGLTILYFYSHSDGIKIGEQTWAKYNLNTTTFRNGDPIQEARTIEEWTKLGDMKVPAWCYYNNNSANGSKYGKLYNWYAVSDPRGICPKGWYVPTDDDITELINYCGGPDSAGKKLKSSSEWFDESYMNETSYLELKNGTNESGFSALPGGNRYAIGVESRENESFHFARSWGCWWTSSSSKDPEYINESAMGINMNSKNSVVAHWSYGKSSGFSCRCIME
jgi:uncharacterized protein (TIGR02145 family)